MLFRKTQKTAPQPFSRVFPTRWIIEYSGILPHCQKQGVAVVHYLQCRRVNASPMPLEKGLSQRLQNAATHEFWCVCKIPKDRGDVRLLFRQPMDLSKVLGSDRQDWIAFKVAQHLQYKLISATSLDSLIRCHSKREYPWCLMPDSLDDYWSAEIRARTKRLVAEVNRN